MLLDINKSKSGDCLVIIDPGGDVHACPTAQDFWECVRSLIDNPDMPEKEQPVPPPRVRPRTSNGEGEFYDENGDDMVAELGGRMLQGLIGGLQNMSYRGKKRGGKKPPPPAEGDG